jgi:excisionase family DNA binding protein
MEQKHLGPGQPTFEMLPEILDVEDLAEYLHMAISTVRTLAHQGRIPSIKIGRRRKFRRDAIGHWLDSLSTDTPASIPEPLSDTHRIHIARQAAVTGRSKTTRKRPT